MKIQCPNCMFIGNVNDEKIIQGLKQVLCPKCKTKIEIDFYKKQFNGLKPKFKSIDLGEVEYTNKTEQVELKDTNKISSNITKNNIELQRPESITVIKVIAIFILISGFISSFFIFFIIGYIQGLIVFISSTVVGSLMSLLSGIAENLFEIRKLLDLINKRKQI